MTLSNSSEICSSCGGPLSSRVLRPYPVILQIVFGVSFALFLVLIDQLKSQPIFVWVWTGVQVVLGILLWRARIMAKKRVYRCVRCERTVR